ncbi:MAG: hypothetical protein ABIP44_13040 [Pseudoxanthomonas sp.]
MPGQNNVSLDVRNCSSGGSDGYTDVVASNGATYSYKYTGGSDGNGNVRVTVGSGQAAINVTVGGDPRYSITNITFNPADSQFTWHAGGQAKVAVIVDTATAVATVKYTVIVTDSTAHCTVPCDPMIQNTPPSK